MFQMQHAHLRGETGLHWLLSALIGACIAVPVRTVGEQSYRIKELKLRFYNCQNMFAPKDEVLLSAASLETIIIRQLRSAHNETLFAQDANAYLDKVLTEAATTVSADSAPDVPTDLTKGVKGHQTQLLQPCHCS